LHVQNTSFTYVPSGALSCAMHGPPKADSLLTSPHLLALNVYIRSAHLQASAAFGQSNTDLYLRGDTYTFAVHSTFPI